MSDLVKNFAFELQRFADQTFTGGAVQGEEGITLSNLFDSQGKIWQVSDASSLDSRTYFWEKQGEDQEDDAPVQLTPADENAPGDTADGITLVKGVYDDVATQDSVTGEWHYEIKSVEAIDASGLNGGTATFASLQGVTKIVNANGTIDIDGDELGAITFNNNGEKAQDSDLDWQVGTVINLDGEGNITSVDAAASEQITNANGVTAEFTTGGTATFVESRFDTIQSFAKDGTAEFTATTDESHASGANTFKVDNVVTSAADGEVAATIDIANRSVDFNATSGDVTYSGAIYNGADVSINGSAVNVASITADSEVVYKYGAEGGDILDLTAVTPDSITTAAKTGGAAYLVANDVSEDDVDINIGGTARRNQFKFGDVGDNGGVFVVENDKATGFVFRDIGDSVTLKFSQLLGFKFYIDSEMLADETDVNSDMGDVEESSLGLTFENEDEDKEVVVTKEDDAYEVEIPDGTTATFDSGATVTFNSDTDGATATLNLNDDGQISSITTSEDSDGTIEIAGMSSGDMVDGTITINDDEFSVGEDDEDLILTQTVNSDGSTETTTNATTVDIGEYGYTVDGLEDGQLLTYTQDEDGTLTGISNIPDNASLTGAFDNIEINGATVDIDSAAEDTTYTFSTNVFTGLKDGDTVNAAGNITDFLSIEEGTFTVLGKAAVIAGDSSVDFTVADEALTGISALNGTATADFSEVLAVNGASVLVTGDEDNSTKVTGSDSGITTVSELSGTVDVAQADGATAIGANGDGQFTFSYASGEVFKVEGNETVETFFSIADSVEAITGLDSGETVTGLFDNGIEVDGQNIQVANGEDGISVSNVDGELQIDGLTDGAALSAADGVTVANSDGSGTFGFADAQSVTIEGDDDGVEFQLDGEGHVTGINGLDDDATWSGENLGSIKINGMSALGIVETENSLGGDGRFNVSGTSAGYIRVSNLGGDVVVSDAGGASQLITNDQVALANNVDGRNITVLGDSSVTFALDEDGSITGITGFDAAGTIQGNINGLTINGEEISVTGDSDDFISYATDGSGNYTLGALDGTSIEVNDAGEANTIVTTGDTSIKVFNDQTFTVADEGKAYDEGTEVSFHLSDTSRQIVTAIGGLYGNVTGDFEDGITVNGDAIQVEGDKSITVYGNDGEDAVSAIGGVDTKASVVSAGNATKVSTSGAGVYTFGDDRYSITADADNAVTFLRDAANDSIEGVENLESGAIVFTVDNTTTTLSVNPTINDDVVITADGKVSVSVNADGEIENIAGIGTVDDVVKATVAATEPTTVNGTAVGITDADKAYTVELDEDGNIEAVNGVTGNATVNVTDMNVVTDADGKFVINGANYTFSDSDGIIGLGIDSAGALTDIDSLEGSVIIADGNNVDLDVNGEEIAITKASSVTAPVTVTSDGDVITAVDGLADGDTITGDLDNAAIAMPGTDDDNLISELTVNDVTYELDSDEDGVVITGKGEVSDLDEESMLLVSEAGTYTVNGQEIEAQAGDLIIGYDNGSYAELYDESTVLIRKGTNVGIIEDRLGLHKYGEGESLGGPDYTSSYSTIDDPLTKEDTDELFEDVANGDENLDRPVAIFADNEGLKETQTLDLSGYDFTKKVYLYRGPQDLVFNSDGGNLVLVGTMGSTLSSGGEKNITLGGGNASNAYGVGDVVVVNEAKAIGNRVNITGGAGDDSVFVRNNADVTFDMGGSVGGADKLITFASSNARVTLTNYDPASGAGIQIEEPHARDSVGGIAQAIEDGNLMFGDGIISVTTAAADGSTNTAEITFDNNSVVGGTLVNLYTPDGTKQGVGFTHSEGGTVGSADRTDDLILIGNSDGKKKGAATLVGGIGNDTVFAGEGDSVNAGAGNNAVVLENDSTRGGANIVIGAGNTTIKNTNNTFYADHGDTLEVDPAAISYDGTNLNISGDGFSAVVANADKNSVTGASTVDASSQGFTATGSYVDQLVKDGNGKTWKMAVGNDGAIIDVKADEDIRADYYKAAGVTFENYNGNVLVDRSTGENNWGNTIDGVEVVFDGVTSIEAGSGNTTLKGSEANETFIAGKGNTSMYGAGGKNLLVGYTDGTDDNRTKEGSTTFFILGDAATGVNTIESFAFVNDNNYTNNSIAADMIEIDTATNLVKQNSIEISGSDVVFSVENRNTGVKETVVVKDAASTTEDDHVRDMRMSDGVIAQVSDSNLYYDKFANFYVATGKNATVQVSNDTDYSKVWLDSVSAAANGAGVTTLFEGDIKVIDATNASVTAELAGNDYNNSIYGGAGDNSLWGGNFGDDLLIGGSGTNRFYYTIGNGADTIQGAKEGDVVDLAGVSLDQISGTDFDEGGSGLTLKFADGGSLRVESATGVSFKVGDDTYTVNDDHNDYNKKV